jgi:hypothetical protein
VVTLFDKNTLDKDPDKDKGHKKLEKGDVVVHIIAAVRLNTEYEADSINTEVCIEAYRGRKLNMHEQPETRDEMLKTNPKYKNMNMDIIDAVMVDKEYQDDIQDHRDREINGFEEPEMGMFKITPKGKCNKLNTKYEASIKVHQGRELNRYEKPEKREMMIKTCGNTVFKNTLDKDPDKDKGHKKLKKRDVVVYINPEDVHMNNVMDEIINTGMFNTKYEAVVVDIIDVGMRNMEYEADSINTEVGIEAYRGRKLSMHEQPEMLKTNPKCKNMNVDITNGVMFDKE